MTGEEVYHAGDSLSPAPDADDAGGIDEWIPRAERWMTLARKWRMDAATDADPYAYFVDGRLSAVQRMADALRVGKHPEPVDLPPPVNPWSLPLHPTLPQLSVGLGLIAVIAVSAVVLVMLAK